MYLKRLEISGFKSFATPLKIDLDPGVTAIVGPNGSGKSNVSDGVRWVLGEQSAKQLRGSKMEDIIFAGSESRKKVNLAEVTLVLDNEDGHMSSEYAEISMTRRLFRTGESEYYLNGTACRRKDLLDLLIDSGLGKEAYSMIGQGEVEKILSSKPEERRVMFEDAAGVLKYKSRKQQSEKKLTETKDNLQRVEDILSELEQQIEPLERQASTAKEYVEKREEYEKLDVSLLSFDIDDKHGQWTSKKNKLQSLQAALETKGGQLEKSVQEQDDVKALLKQIDQQLEDSQKELLEVSERLTQLEGHRELMNERGSNAHVRLEELEQRMTAIETSWQESKKSLDAEAKQLEDKEANDAKLEKRWNTMQKEMSKTQEDFEVELESLKTTYIDVLNEQAALKNEMRYRKEQQEKVKRRMDALDEEHSGAKGSLEEKQTNFDHMQQQIESLETKKQTVQEEVSESKQHVEHIQANKQKQSDHLHRGYRSYEDVKARIDLLERMEQEHAGFFQGVKAVMQGQDHGQLSGVLGPVASLIHATKKFELAIETALGGALQHIVVDTDQNGRKAIAYLKAKKQGRATFLPQNVMKPRFVQSSTLKKLEQQPGFECVANKAVANDDHVQNVIDHLLGGIIIVSDLESGQAIAKASEFRHRIVTLDGDVINPGGSMTGGSEKKKGQELLGRKREQKELLEKKRDIEAAISDLEQTVKDKTNELDEAMQLSQRKEAALEELAESLQRAKEDLHLQRHTLQQKQSEHSLYVKEKNVLDQELIQWTEEKETNEQKAIELSERSISLEQEINEKEAEKKRQALSEKEMQEQVTLLRIERAKQKEQLDHQKQTVKRLQTEVSEQQRELVNIKEEREALTYRLEDVSGGTSTIDEDIEKARESKEKWQTYVEAKRKEREETNERLGLVEQAVTRFDTEYRDVDQERQHVELVTERLDVELDHLLDRLQGEYELTYEAAKKKRDREIPIEDARKRLKLLERGIEELGYVNLGAIEEYERVSERYQFLKAQQEDLREARQTLVEAIREMDEEMTRKFRETFVQIREQFKETYRVMFGGGEADLVLSEPDDLLETGIDIFARPPGKKKQALSLLSGGEKSLTAIALLFAILNVRPVPFCILDEVEAALDEANVKRFANYLQRFSEQTQFIVITHRKGTMAASDSLYGVTMEESGVSRLVSVRLEEAEMLEPAMSTSK
ncbi:hypothetical protein DH09_04580 [Bacillaceae bacterium JMAK1]|nr:hypothetical protein DH09_04580 [Bacillaceae bacterium JMAK1]